MRIRSAIGKATWWASGKGRIQGPLSELFAFSRLDEEAQEAAVLGRMRASLHFFSQFDFAPRAWREAAATTEPEAFLEAWRRIPITTKAELRGPFAPEALREAGIAGELGASSGSTGEPTRFLHDQEMERATSAARVYTQLERGWRAGLPIVSLWGSPRDIGAGQRPKARLSAWLRDLHLLGAYHLGPHTLDELAALTARMPHFALYGFPSMLDYVAGQILERGDERFRGRVAVAWTGGEVLTDAQRQTFEAAFGVPLLNHYGGRELSAIAFERRAGEPLDVLRPFLLVEILDEAGDPCPPGVSGRIVCTHLASRGTPFLRYDTGDLGAAAAAQDGFATSLEGVAGRSTDAIPLPGGGVLHGIFWYGMVRNFPEVDSFQVRYSARRVRVLVVAPRLPEAGLARFTETVEAMVPGLAVAVDRVDEIPRTAQGKLLRIVHDPQA